MAFTSLAEREGFEPSVPLRVHYLSRVARSTALAPLQNPQRQSSFGWPKYKKLHYLHAQFSSIQRHSTFQFLDRLCNQIVHHQKKDAYNVISPQMGSENFCLIVSTSSYLPNRCMSLVTVASVVISLPESTPKSSNALDVSYLPCFTDPAWH